ncbi:helix-turn-helix domain-containing protein [Microbacterium oleivorans]|uniref:helix-turn-helix transcriptional regulator n=1 Tax=Microbacterium oleivorans TaxID=273677 RepID=UPI0009EE8DAC
MHTERCHDAYRTALLSHLAQALREKRRSAGLSQTEVAQRAAVSVVSYRALESETNSATNPRIDTVIRIVAALGLPIEVILSGVPSRECRDAYPPCGSSEQLVSSAGT